MITTMNKDAARRSLRDASDGPVTTGGRTTGNGVDAGGSQTVWKDMATTSGAATGGDAIKKNTDAAERQLHQAAEGLRGTMEISTKAASDRTLRNLEAMMQTSVKLAGGFRSVMREWTDYTRDAMRCNVEGMTGIMSARTMSDLMAAQSDLLNAEVLLMLNSGARISEATARAVKDAGQTIGERTQQRDRQKNS
jgi:hypothetical protein